MGSGIERDGRMSLKCDREIDRARASEKVARKETGSQKKRYSEQKIKKKKSISDGLQIQ